MKTATKNKEWVNWSESLRFEPEEISYPENEDEVKRLIVQSLENKRNIRIAGAGHSSVPLVETKHTLISQENLKGLIDYNTEKKQVKLLPGTSISEAGDILIRLRLSMHNTGDVDMQNIAGAFGTGTHGSGIKLQNLSGMMVGCKLIDGQGTLREFSLEKDPEMIKALRVSLGALGFFTELTIQAETAEQFYRKEFCTHIETCLEHLDDLIHKNRMFDFYWYPRNDEAKIRICNVAGEGMQEIPFAEKVKETSGWLYEILPQERALKFDEMEYAFPFETAVECFKEIRNRIKEKHRSYVAWRVLFRTVAADDSYISPFSNRDAVTIAVLQNNELEYKKYFEDIEPIFRAYNGRPHWGKKHTLKAKELEALYPEWNKFMKIRKEMDPEGIFLNDYLKELLGQ